MTTTDDAPGGTDPESSGPRIPERLGSLELPPTGTGARAARRAAQSANQDGGRPSVAAAPASERPGVDVAEPAAEPASIEAGPTRPSRRFLLTFVGGLVVCLLAATALTWVGVQTLRDSTAGRRVASAEPDQPGFEGFLEPTPTMAVFHARGDLLQFAAVLALSSGNNGGSVILVPANVNVGDLGNLGFALAFGASLDGMRESMEVVTTVGIQEAQILDDDAWADLVRPVSPLVVENPDAVGRFPAGRVELAPEDVGDWLSVVGDAESELAHLYRVELFWEAWLAAVADAGGTTVPGPSDVGLGRFIRGLAAGSSQVTTLPVTEHPEPDGPSTFDVDHEAVASLISAAVPFPLGTLFAPRMSVRLLDGTGDQTLVARMAGSVVQANATIVVVGNADRFDYRTTQIRYHRPEHREAAEQIREQLGTGEVIEDVRPIDSFGVTIVLGTDVED